MITFNAQKEMPELDQPRIRQWVERVAAGYGRQVGTVNYLFCDDEYILDVNRRFLGHDYYTDVITFDYSTDTQLSGDIIISLDTIGSNAQLFGTEYATELRRIIIHGILHLTGQGDKTPETRKEMTRKEDLALALYE